jgi:hypothetical protein
MKSHKVSAARNNFFRSTTKAPSSTIKTMTAKAPAPLVVAGGSQTKAQTIASIADDRLSLSQISNIYCCRLTLPPDLEMARVCGLYYVFLNKLAMKALGQSEVILNKLDYPEFFTNQLMTNNVTISNPIAHAALSIQAQ